MKLRTKCSISMFLLTIMFIMSSFFLITAYASDDKLAVSVGKDFGDGVNTIQDATDASAAYVNAGYSTVTFTSPIKSDFTNTNLICRTLK